mmetsp:Transcript_1142/g.1249  ORF Transcript_1142/g.1249 Transcript_1142/m.1249 type:complete len:82 (-) Transcript_1142:167-412(-)|eukprot:Skav235384  [mRNA]  locus=scaffold1262:56655:56900:- [translate_table: standard]
MPGMKCVFYLCVSMCAVGLLGCEEQNPNVVKWCGTHVFEQLGCNVGEDLREACAECVERWEAEGKGTFDICKGDAVSASDC